MHCVVFVPGTMGTELFSAAGEKVWPPRPLEVQFGYDRVDELVASNVRMGDVVKNVSCFDVYGSLLEQFRDLGYPDAPGTGDKRLVTFPYDWRLDLEDTADALATLFDRLYSEGTRRIDIVAHSMGGLVSRLVLETGRYVERPWFPNIANFFALATPHQGAPLALARILGLDSDMGIGKADFRRLTNDRRYPSGYQLLSAPTEQACWDMADMSVGALDIYDPATAQALGLDAELLQRARWVHDSLAIGAAPAQVRYFYFAGTGHETVTRVNVLRRDDGYLAKDMVVTRTEDAGDGTVPFWSALPRPVQKQVVVGEHMKVFRDMPFKRVFWRLLGGDLGTPLQAADGHAEEPLMLSLAKPVIEVDQVFELLLIPSAPVAPLEGRLMLTRLDDRGRAAGAPEELAAVAYRGPRVSRLRLELPPVPTPGLYELRFEGTPSSTEPVRFAVASLPGTGDDS